MCQHRHSPLIWGWGSSVVSLDGVQGWGGGCVWGRVVGHLSEVGLRGWARSGGIRWELPRRQTSEGRQWDTALGVGRACGSELVLP